MNNYGELINPTTLKFVRLLPGPIERVWEYLTDDHKRALWFAGGSTDLTPGGDMKLVFSNSQLSSPPDPTPEKYKDYGDGYVSQAKILRCEAPRLLKISWEGVVTFELEEIENKVKLTLIHEKLQDDNETRVGTLAGWHTHLDILFDKLNDKAPEGFWSVHMPLEDEYRLRIT
ncbi:MAG: SRPBCC family protein [Bacteroidota bacterium]